MNKKLISLACLVLLTSSLPAADEVDYTKEVKPLLAKYCYSCHGADKQRAGLRLDTAKAIKEGGNHGPSFLVGKSSDSLLIKAITGSDTEKVRVMPPKEPRLTPGEIAKLRAWIDQGAKAPADEVVETKKNKSNHWAFQPIQRPELPKVTRETWVRNPIDRFVLARLDKEKIQPSPEADRVTLIRRLSLDLIGLPPTIAEVEAFVNDTRPDAYERLVERLLASPHYGERWGRHWLDLARYADSNGYTIDGPRTIWKYRDWVINAFNRDLPFDQFVTEQLAGDLLPNATPDQRVATGFHRNTTINQEGGIDVEMFRVESIVDRVATTGTVFLGLTIGCCQCHDHKFDPISQREYYQFFAFLNNCDEPTLDLATKEQQKRRVELQQRIAGVEKGLKLADIAPAGKIKQWEDKLTGEAKLNFPEDVQRILNLADNSRDNKDRQLLSAFYLSANHVPHIVAGLGDTRPFMTLANANASIARSAVDRYRAELRQAEAEITTTMVLKERAAPRVTNVMIQGDFTRKGVPVGPGTPSVLHELKEAKTLNRLTLAQWLVDPANPLTARVTMNRIWQAYFGLGIVETENDFGTQGTPPSHPELLDWLASEFVKQKWSMKEMHRLIVTSATYRQASKHRPDLLTVDARNRLLARQNRIRLEAEIVRDVGLSASGLLSPKIGGPSVFPPQPDGVFRLTQVQRTWKSSDGEDRYRRGMYTYYWRSAAHPALSVFDAPDANGACTRRNRSNTPLQALTLLNDEAFFEMAQGLAVRILKESGSDSDRIRQAFRLCLSRLPSDREEAVVKRLLAQQRADFEKHPQDVKLVIPSKRADGIDGKEMAAWMSVSRALLNIDEFITRE